MNTLRRRLRMAVIIALMALLTPLAAAADPPTESTFVLVHEDQPNPCRPGEVVDWVRIEFTINTHEHRNNTVRTIEADITQSNGFVGTGHQTDVFVGELLRTTVKHVLHHPGTGERFSVTIRFWQDTSTGEFVRGEPFPTMQCIRAAT